MGAEKRGIEEQRLLLGEAALLSPTKAAELMPMRDSEALSLLRREGLVRSRGGYEVVRWGDVVAWFDRKDREGNSPQGKIKLPRVSLED